jgi:hypothetical protein
VACSGLQWLAVACSGLQYGCVWQWWQWLGGSVAVAVVAVWLGGSVAVAVVAVVAVARWQCGL